MQKKPSSYLRVVVLEIAATALVLSRGLISSRTRGLISSRTQSDVSYFLVVLLVLGEAVNSSMKILFEGTHRRVGQERVIYC